MFSLYAGMKAVLVSLKRDIQAAKDRDPAARSTLEILPLQSVRHRN